MIERIERFRCTCDGCKKSKEFEVVRSVERDLPQGWWYGAIKRDDQSFERWLINLKLADHPAYVSLDVVLCPICSIQEKKS